MCQGLFCSPRHCPQGERAIQQQTKGYSNISDSLAHLGPLDPSDSECERERDFRIKHFAGDVVYNSVGFLDKNSDTLFQDLKRVLYSCELPALKTMWPEGADAVSDGCTKACLNTKQLDVVHKNPATAGTNFHTSMDELVNLLMAKVW